MVEVSTSLTQHDEQPGQFIILGAREPDSVMRPIEGRQKLKAGVDKGSDPRDVYQPVGREPPLEKVLQRRSPGALQRARNRDPPYGSPVQGKRTMGPRGVAPQLADRVGTASNCDDPRVKRRRG